MSKTAIASFAPFCSDSFRFSARSKLNYMKGELRLVLKILAPGSSELQMVMVKLWLARSPFRSFLGY